MVAKKNHVSHANPHLPNSRQGLIFVDHFLTPMHKLRQHHSPPKHPEGWNGRLMCPPLSNRKKCNYVRQIIMLRWVSNRMHENGCWYDKYGLSVIHLGCISHIRHEYCWNNCKWESDKVFFFFVKANLKPIYIQKFNVVSFAKACEEQ